VQSHPRRVIGAMTPHPPSPAREACVRTIHWNLGDPDSYPEMVEEKHDLIDRFSRIVFGRTMPGELTSGASESNMLAALYWRARGKKRIIATPGTHYSVRKAAILLGMEYQEQADPQPTRDDLLVLTVGKTEYGMSDPVGDLVERAARAGAGVHVDAAYAGTIARLVDPSLVPQLDSTLATLTVDLHKIPESPPPAGVLFAAEEGILEQLWWRAPYIPTGRQFGLLGTRPGCIVRAASISLRLVVEERPGGPSSLLHTLNSIIEDIVSRLETYGFQARGGPFPIRCLEHPKTGEILDQLRKQGVSAYRCGGGRGVRIVALPHHEWEGYEWVIKELQEAARAVGGVKG